MATRWKIVAKILIIKAMLIGPNLQASTSAHFVWIRLLAIPATPHQVIDFKR